MNLRPSLTHSNSINEHSRVGSGTSTTSDIEDGERGRIGDNANEGKQIGRKETNAVLWLKGAVVMVLLVAASIMVTLTYRYCSSQERIRFETKFSEDVQSLKDSYNQLMADRHWVAISILDRFRTEQQDDFGLIPDFDHVGVTHLQLARATAISYAPLLESKQNVTEFIEFASKNQDWLGIFRADWDHKVNRTVENGMWKFDSDGNIVDDAGSDSPILSSPIWQITPLTTRRKSIMFNQFSEDRRRRAIVGSMMSGMPIISQVLDAEFERNLCGERPPVNITAFGEFGEDEQFFSLISGEIDENPSNSSYPTSIYFFPHYDKSGDIVGHLGVEFQWDSFFGLQGLLDCAPIRVVLEDMCHGHYTYTFTKGRAHYLGNADLHDSNYDDLRGEVGQEDLLPYMISSRLRLPFPPGYRRYAKHVNLTLPAEDCRHKLYFYATKEYESNYTSGTPANYAIAVAMIFVFAIMIFCFYDFLVERRLSVVMDAAVKSNAIVDSLFPAGFRERLFGGNYNRASTPDVLDEETNSSTESASFFTMISPRVRLQSYLSSPNGRPQQRGSIVPLSDDPIAEMFPDCTIIFADIAGFTAWSSEREPSQVFQLLETLYSAYDETAAHLGVFKVETIGDCYVAVTGLPEPNKTHAVIMARFANEIVIKTRHLTRQLERTLGPGTSDLALRAGLHSGAVTAGILRGSKSRFQLFGDTMNTTSRIESTGKSNRVHLSEATAEALRSAGKGHWVCLRDELVQAKGLGEIQTYWLTVKSRAKAPRSTSSGRTDEVSLSSEDTRHMRNGGHATRKESELWEGISVDGGKGKLEQQQFREEKLERLVDWNTEVLLTLLDRVVGRRKAETSARRRSMTRRSTRTAIDIADFRANVQGKAVGQGTGPLQVSPAVREQMREYVKRIASFYHQLPFHNFEHASHVLLSSVKLLNRIIIPTDDVRSQAIRSSESRRTLSQVEEKRKSDNFSVASSAGQTAGSELHSSSFGISADPLLQFVIVFAALVHDVDHPGISNTDLTQCESELAKKYGNSSIAERNSVDVAIDELSSPKYRELQECIYCNDDEFRRFETLLKQSVLATDIMDPDSRRKRALRWEKAFGAQPPDEPEYFTIKRKRIIVTEHIIQASDVAHTMQHWHIFIKYNEQLCQEMHLAHSSGRSKFNPLPTWYKDQLTFFDTYVIPLAQKLKDCGVFGVSSDECLNWALQNRSEWERKGQAITREMRLRIDKPAPPKISPKPLRPEASSPKPLSPKTLRPESSPTGAKPTILQQPSLETLSNGPPRMDYAFEMTSSPRAA